MLQRSSSGDILTMLASRGYKIGKTIGEGSYSKVKHALIKSKVKAAPHKKIAVKIINKAEASNDFVTKFLPREMSIIREIQHPHIVDVYDSFECENRTYIFMEYCEKGDLLHYIQHRGAICEITAKVMFRQLVDAVSYLHDLDIAHRDLKCENILLVDYHTVKLTDFGFARRVVQDGMARLSQTFCGSVAYAAPEILQGVPYNPKMYDAWSLGCVLFIMLTGTMPFDDSRAKDMLRAQFDQRILFPNFFEGPRMCHGKALILQLLDPDVTRRATIARAAQSPWLNN